MNVPETGGLFNLAVGLMQLFSDCKEDFSTLAGILGLYFQIRDDYSNLCSQEVRHSIHLMAKINFTLKIFNFFFFKYSDNKSYCEDLTEGKFSFPIIHAIQSHPEDRQVMSILLMNLKNNRFWNSAMKDLNSITHRYFATKN